MYGASPGHLAASWFLDVSVFFVALETELFVAWETLNLVAWETGEWAKHYYIRRGQRTGIRIALFNGFDQNMIILLNITAKS